MGCPRSPLLPESPLIQVVPGIACRQPKYRMLAARYGSNNTQPTPTLHSLSKASPPDEPKSAAMPRIFSTGSTLLLVLPYPLANLNS
jgi:hypothetical protein